MSDKSSATYIIDQDFNIISCNKSILELYPQLKKGEKCYKCLMDLDEPCEACPVVNNILGPKTYMDPIRKIYETVDAVEVDLGDGNIGHALVISTVGESEAVSKRLPRTHRELQKLLEQEYYDSLTGGFSRKGFIREAGNVLENSGQLEYAIAMFDIRNFKAINDTFGVEGGDQVLKYVFDYLESSWMEPIVSARIESDWFVFLVESDKMKNGDLEELLNIEWNTDTHNAHIHLCGGVYFIEDKDAEVSSMVDGAILAEESSELEECGNFAVFNESMRKSYVDSAGIISSFQSSIRNHDFKVYLQPVIRTEDEKICSAEALARWEHPTMGFVSPADFIPVLEKNGLISRLDQYIMERVYEFQESLLHKGMKFVPISVNLSRQDFYNDHLVGGIISLAEKGDLPKGAVNYEVTETSVAALKQNCSYLFDQIRQAGARVFLDDFGSGYSSLGMIGDYSFDVIKIDKSLIDQIEDNPTVRAIITSTIDMCHKIGLKAVAEGVETQCQLDFLKRYHCDYIQGFIFAKPMSEEDFLNYLSSSQDMVEEGDQTPVEPAGIDFDFDNLVDLVDHSGMFIQACHTEDYTMVFANELTRLVSGHPEEPYRGKKCYKYMLGLDAPCGHCPMKKMGDEKEKEVEVDDGEHVFSLKARYTEWNGRKVFIEYGRDVTNTKIAQRRYTSHIRSILENIPEGQGVFHVDLTADKWLSSGGNAQNARNMQNVKDVNTLIHMIASFVPDEEGQERFFKKFSREAQLETYNEDKHQIVLETLSYFDDMSIRWSRVTAQLIDNPNNGHIESIIYGIDISKERSHVEELERERLQNKQEKERLEKEVEEAWDMYTRADRDRRYDYLTGLNSRLDLHNELEQAARGEVPPITAITMIDIDRFKNVNDKYGHAVGDKCLKALGKTILDFGIENGISFYRYGGEEIVGLIRGDKNEAPPKISRLLEEIRNMKIKIDNGDEITLTASIGYTTKGGDYQEMINRADQAMYLAKKRGKDQLACID
ncbi:MAG: EAL domain-containing protein [Coriobacteriales bacterium]